MGAYMNSSVCCSAYMGLRQCFKDILIWSSPSPMICCGLHYIIIYSNECGQHLKALQAVLQELRLASLTANLEKCALGKAETKYLGFLVGQGYIHPLTDKIEANREYLLPQTKKNKCEPSLDWLVTTTVSSCILRR